MEAVEAPDLATAVAGERTRLRIPSRPEWIEKTAEYLQTRALSCGACSPERSGRLLLALHEALTNSVIHGNLEISSELKESENGDFGRVLAERSADPVYADRPVDVVVDYNGERCTWTITDQGRGFDVERMLSRRPDDDDLPLTSGRGIFLMQAFLDDLRYEAGGRRAVLTMRRPEGAERRQHFRVPFPDPVRVVPLRPDGTLDWHAAQEGVARNLSEGGIGLLQSTLSASRRVLLSIEVDGKPIYIPAEVCRSEVVSEGVVEVGCRFRAGDTPVECLATGEAPDLDIELAQNAVRGLLERLQTRPIPPQERRAHPRVAYTEQITVQAGDTETSLAYARDLSKSGIAFVTAHPVLPGTKVRIGLSHQSGPEFHVRAEVIRCTRIIDGFYDIAGRFVGLMT